MFLLSLKRLGGVTALDTDKQYRNTEKQSAWKKTAIQYVHLKHISHLSHGTDGIVSYCSPQHLTGKYRKRCSTQTSAMKCWLCDGFRFCFYRCHKYAIFNKPAIIRSVYPCPEGDREAFIVTWALQLKTINLDGINNSYLQIINNFYLQIIYCDSRGVYIS